MNKTEMINEIEKYENYKDARMVMFQNGWDHELVLEGYAEERLEPEKFILKDIDDEHKILMLIKSMFAGLAMKIIYSDIEIEQQKTEQETDEDLFIFN